MYKFPNEHEKTAEETFTEMVEMASVAPRVTDEEFKTSKGEFPQFGNNFFLLFLALKQRDENPVITETYLTRAETLGDNWKRFLEENQSLIDRISSALEERMVYAKLLRKYRDFSKIGRADLADKIANELKMEQIGMAAWNKLNPLLEEAANRMKGCGIDPTEFFG